MSSATGPSCGASLPPALPAEARPRSPLVGSAHHRSWPGGLARYSAIENVIHHSSEAPAAAIVLHAGSRLILCFMMIRFDQHVAQAMDIDLAGGTAWNVVVGIQQ
ncbi:MAG: hypothetical protein QOG19_2087 [Mycobacterium sp.]|nr:hypothetical protein [Mycobacterium sp.]